MSPERIRIKVTPPMATTMGASSRTATWALVAKKAEVLFSAACRRGQDQCGQATKGVWGMSWRQEAKKGVEDCDKPGGLVKRELIPGCPNDPALNP